MNSNNDRGGGGNNNSDSNDQQQHQQTQQQQHQLRALGAAHNSSSSMNHNPDYTNMMMFNGGNSPSHIAMTGHEFSTEELQDILGSVGNFLPHNEDETTSGGVDFHSITYGNTTATAATTTTTSCSGGGKGNDSDYEIKSSGCGGGGDGGGDSGEEKFVARTERKRSREKQRRSDVNKQFSDLTSCLRYVESEYDAEELRTAALPTVFSPSNRADLLARTVALLNALHATNKRRKKELDELQGELENSRKAGEEMAAKLKENIMAPQSVGGNKVMVMVPMMLGGDGQQAAMPMMNPWGMNMPHAYMPMPAAPSMSTDTTHGSMSSNNNNNAGVNNNTSNNDTSGQHPGGILHPQQQQHASMMPWTMPAPTAQAPPSAMPMPYGHMMMPQYGGMTMMMQPSPSPPMHVSSSLGGGGKTDKSDNTSTNNSNNASAMGSNLAHCA